MRMPVPMPLTRLCELALENISSVFAARTVRSLWMLTTASRTRLTTSTTGVCRRFQLRGVLDVGNSEREPSDVAAVGMRVGTMGAGGAALPPPPVRTNAAPSSQQRTRFAVIHFPSLSTNPAVRGRCMLMSPLDYALGAGYFVHGFDRGADKAARGLARFTISPPTEGR